MDIGDKEESFYLPINRMSISMQGNKKNSQSNSPSKLLSNEENEILFKVMGPRCQAQVSAVVQVFCTEPPSHSSWRKLHCGVVTFTKDNSRRSYFIQVFDIMKEQKVMEQEIYNLFTYHTSLPFFHQFEGENQMVGLNFADVQEAEAFSQVITDRLDAKLRKREERKRQQQHEISSQQPNLQLQSQQRPQNSGLQNNIQTTHIANRNRARKGKKGHKIRKDQIGEPKDFIHITHVGFDQDKGFSSFYADADADERLQEFFKMAGVSPLLLQDDNTRRFIYDFIDQHGGVERATEETKVYGSIKRAPSVGGDKESRKSSESLHQKPALPSRNSNPGAPPPPPPPRPHHNNHPQTAPPPPPPPKEKSFPPEKEITSTHIGNHSAPPPPPPPRIPSANGGVGRAPSPRVSMLSEGSGGGGPAAPPPPPPPPPSGGPGPALPVPSNPVPSNSLQNRDTRNDLLSQIRQRPTLNPVSQLKIEKPEKDSRTNLMSEIRKREYELKPVVLNNGDSSPMAVPVENSMAAMLARALEGRAKAIQNESDSDEEEEDEEEEWDDN